MCVDVFYLFKRVLSHGKWLKRFMELFCFDLTEYHLVWIHGDPKYIDFDKFVNLAVLDESSCDALVVG